ncbi:Plexin-A1 [Phytophthora citrophthora]|uniref:Plexin-A1 n=1 Tax=Phytophthora citrophthora TaxID=4793 RepID=A0AAD9H2I9_9STRA|nr:Plexin-A1 [Phytophthora citrophthora]
MIRPTTGPDRGGTRVLVSGGPFTVNGGYWCHFGGINVQAAYLSSTQIFCVSPPSQSRSVKFSVSGDNFSEFDIPHLRYTFQPAPVAITISPSRGSQSGQYQVTIQGLNFVLSSGLRCRFGDSHIVAGKWLSDTSIACVVPPHSPGWVDIQVTNNLQDYSVETLRFEYVVSPIVLDFEPASMYAQNPKELTIFGRDFQNSTSLRCIIGNDLTIATFVSDSQIRCAPANLVEASVVVGAIDLALSMIRSVVNYRLKVLDDGVWSLRPRISSVRGMTPIILTRSENDQPLDIEDYYGRFCSQNDHVCSELTPTDLKEPNKFSWFPPKWAGPDLIGVVEFFRGSNISLTSSAPITTFPFRYYREIELSKLTPPIGSIAGGTIVTLVGAYFQDSLNLSCVLNGATFTPARFITDTMVNCTSPPFVSGPRDISVFVSLNGLEVSETSLSFQYEEDPSVFSIFPVGGPVSGSTIFNKWNIGDFDCATGSWWP